MGFTWTEIKKWGISKNLEAKKVKDVGYVFDNNAYSDLDSLVMAMWNKLTNNKWVEYQEKYKSEK